MMKILISLILGLVNLALIIASGILYRLGGASDLQDGYDHLRKRNMRLIGVSLVTAILLLPTNLMGLVGLFFTVGVSVGALSLGYGGRGEPKHEQSFLYRIFGEETFFAVGFLFGLALFPFAITEYLSGNMGAVMRIVFRTIVLTLLIPIVHHFRKPVKIYKWEFDETQVEEFGRGVAITSTLLLV